ncbi:MAG: chorismate lyase [Pseudomonas sp.]|uniref:chorismate--pyruvate lyase family protein n=1 Tax=Pseudomonas sp. TaxID=306 RepID=UPI003398C264
MPVAPFCETPRWLEAAALQPEPSSQLADWLFDQGSLTRRLTALSNGAFSITPLLQGWQTLRDDECLALAVPLASVGWVREVYLRGHEEPWVFARSVAARRDLSESQFDLESLGSRSLGELLFSDSAFTRGALQAARCPGEWLPAAVREDGLWARRSCFRRAALGVLVVEVFLPAFWSRAAPPGL